MSRILTRPPARSPRPARLLRYPRARPIRRVPPLPAPVTGIDWEASGWAGLAAGAVFLFMQAALAAASGGEAADPVRAAASLALGESILPPGAPFTALILLAAAAVHLPLSLIYARVLAAMIDGMRPAASALAGAGFGAALYFLNYHVFSGLFPWFALARGWAPLASHAVFGVIAGGIYAVLTSGTRARS